jgi:hypothetical protein
VAVASNRYLIAASKLIQTFVNSLISNEDISDDRSIVNKMVNSIRGYAAEIIYTSQSPSPLMSESKDMNLLAELVAKVNNPVGIYHLWRHVTYNIQARILAITFLMCLGKCTNFRY